MFFKHTVKRRRRCIIEYSEPVLGNVLEVWNTGVLQDPTVRWVCGLVWSSRQASSKEDI